MESKESNYKMHSGVIVLHELSSECIILTKRTIHLRRHPGEVCFPGGGWEADDKTLFDTAIRELHEELGIDSSRVSLIRGLSEEKTLLGSIIHPWFASIESINPYLLNEMEVDKVIKVPIKLVVNPDLYQQIIIERKGIRFTSCQFIGDKEFIWGATARIMKQLISFLL